jgi:hypothetical protein
VPRVDISSLSLGNQLGGGGQGKVVAVEGFRIKGQWPAALKTYSQDVLPEINAAALEELVGLPRQLAPAASSWLYENTAWPAAVVEDDGLLAGFLMRVVPAEYYFDFQTQAHGTQPKLADIAFLLNSDQYVSSCGIPVSERDRLMLLRALAVTLSRLHDLDMCIGDLSPKNLLFRLAPAPSCFVLDCDAMRVRGQTVLPQVDTPDWEVPHGETTATRASDSYKFGLLAIRLFARDQSSRDIAPLAAVSPELGGLAALSQEADPSRRPAPGAWIPALEAATPQASPAPVTVSQQAAAPSQIAIPIPAMDLGDGLPQPEQRAQPGPPPARGEGPPPVTRRWLKPTLFLVAAVLLIGIAAAGILLTRSPAQSTPQALPGAATQTPTAGADDQSTPPLSASDEATQLNNLLNSSATSRNAVSTAVNDAGSCTDLSGAITAIQNVSQERSDELSQATSLQVNALPDGQSLQSDLVNALTYSLAADQDFLRWAQSLLNGGCSDPAPETSAYQAGFSESAKAGVAKTQFVQLWNPIADTQGLPTRSDNFI